MNLYTVGHGRRTLDEFVGLLKRYEITAIADVRTKPVSRWAPWFNKAHLSRILEDEGITYLFMGEELGGRPDDDDLYTDEGYVKYRRVGETSLFKDGFDRLVESANSYNIAVMCSESDPAGCHRNLLIGRVAEIGGLQVTHINKSGELEDFDLRLLNDGLAGLEDEWISAVKVREAADTTSHSH